MVGSFGMDSCLVVLDDARMKTIRRGDSKGFNGTAFTSSGGDVVVDKINFDVSKEEIIIYK